MRITLKEMSALNVKRVRREVRRGRVRQSLTLRNGVLYTMKYNPGEQPRTESQEKSWATFREANRLAARDFSDPKRREYWKERLKGQERYKTARGLAKAYYIGMLKRKMAKERENVERANAIAVSHLRPRMVNNQPDYRPMVQRERERGWVHYRNIAWYRETLTRQAIEIEKTPPANHRRPAGSETLLK